MALLRGMNIGGNRLPVTRLREVAAGIGWRNVRSYLASGNLIATVEGPTDALSQDLERALAAVGLAVPVLVLTDRELGAALASCPFQPARGQDVHAFFLWSDPVVDTDALHAFRAPSEELEVRGRVAWLHAPEGIGRSKLADRLHRVVKETDMTARNLNTVRALADLVDDT
ncbi:MAG: DUF1697 domain-containing protein [Nocardioides sp.]